MYKTKTIVRVAIILAIINSVTTYQSYAIDVTSKGETYEKVDTDNNNEVLVVFIHGIRGSSYSWGDLLQIIRKDSNLRKFDLLFWDYPSGLLDNTTIMQAADLLETHLRNEFVTKDYRSIALISHSMGGLIARQFILNNAIQNNRSVLDKTSLLVNIATPHLGTNLAKLASVLSKNVNLSNMSSFSEYLQKSSDTWKSLIEDQKLWRGILVAVAGTEDDIVPYASVRHQYNRVESLPYGHLNIARVHDKNHGLYRLLVRYLLEIKHAENISSNILRVAYLSCTGPYNINEDTLSGKFLNQSSKAHMLINAVWENYKHITRKNSRVKTDDKRIFHVTGGTSNYIQVDTALIDEIFGTKAYGSIEDRKKFYKNYFSKRPIKINDLYHAGILPTDLANIWELNRQWNHNTVTSVFQAAHSEELVIGLDLPVMRVKTFFVQNVSNGNLRDVVIHAKFNDSGPQGAFRAPYNDKGTKRYTFPLEVLKPGESIAVMTGIKLVNPYYASGGLYDASDPDYSESRTIYDGRYEGVEVKANGDTHLVDHSEVINRLSQKNADSYNDGVLRSIRSIDEANYAPITFGPQLDIIKVTYFKENERSPSSYIREERKFDMIAVNDTCACGSSPTLAIQGDSGKWIGILEMFAGAKGRENAEEFYYDIPAQTKKIAIIELPGEISTIQDLRLYFQEDEKWREWVPTDRSSITITRDKPFLLDISNITKDSNGSKMVVSGKGYYMTKAKSIAPPVLQPSISLLNQYLAGNR